MASSRKKTNGAKYPFRVGRSRTGLGAFATEPIKKGKFIVEYTGPLLNNEQCEKVDNKYLFEVNARWFIDGSAAGTIRAAINHSCVGAIVALHRSIAPRTIKPGGGCLRHWIAAAIKAAAKCDQYRRQAAPARNVPGSPPPNTPGFRRPLRSRGIGW